MKKKNCLHAVLFLMLLPAFAAAQNNRLLQSRQTSEHTYVYKLTEKEAERVNRKGVGKIDSTYFHTLALSYPTDSVLHEKLPAGHYVKTFSDRNRQRVLYTYVPDFEVFVLNNNTDLCIQVYAADGTLIRDARVKAGAQKLAFDTKTQSYVQRKSYRRKGILQVSHGGNTAYFRLTGTQSHTRFGLGMRKLLYASPVKYAWMPIDLTARVSGDAIASVHYGWPRGTIASMKRFFGKLFHPSDYRDVRQQGYMVFNKPKYLPADTVKFKAFLVDKNGRPLKKSARVRLNNTHRNFDLADLQPYRHGAFEYAFALHDSLDLRLDKSYNLFLENSDGDVYFTSSFRYEDYELNPTKLTINVPAENQYNGREFRFFAKGTDDNELNLMDARLEITATARNIEKFIPDAVFVPDTLWTHKMDLKPAGETEIIVPDSAFPQANFRYTLHVRMLTSDNKTFAEQKEISYFYRRENIELALENDSIGVIFRENGVETPRRVHLTATDNFGNQTEAGSETTPYKIPLNVYYKTYTAQSGDAKETLDVSAQPSLLQCLSSRTNDSVFIRVENPRKLNFTYNIYERNREKFRGHSESLDMENRSNSHENYYVSIRYLWGGTIVNENYRIPFFDKKLNISVSQPALVYPGQRANIEVTVTDQRGKPVENVDVTAFSLTKKFDYRAPALPYLGKNKPEKTVINNFSIHSHTDAQTDFPLNYAAWKVLANIDSVEYYKFLYPQREVYSFAHKTEENITQFAPFVVADGAVQPVYAVYVNDVPVYFEWTNRNQPYSFRVEPNRRHRVKIRLADRSIILKNATFKKGHKAILSIPKNLQNADIQIIKEKTKFSAQEKNTLYRYVFPYRNTFRGNLAYIKNGENYFLLNRDGEYGSGRSFAGPVAGKRIDFELFVGYKQTFDHEPYFEYDFAPNIVKMREVKSSDFPLNKHLHTSKNLENNLSDTVLTHRVIQKMMQDVLERRRQNQTRYVVPSRTEKGNGSLLVERIYSSGKTPKIPLNTLILKADDERFIRVYRGAADNFQNLEAGAYKIITFYAGSYYHLADSVRIKADGRNFVRIRVSPDNLKKDAFSMKVNALIQESILKNARGEQSQTDELNQIYTTYRSENVYTGDGKTVQGRIVDEDNEPVIGANIVVKGTNYGTVSDIDGFYTLNVPRDKYILDVLYIGYKPYQIDTRRTFSGDAVLEPDSEMLDEVVVTGFGAQRRTVLTGAVQSISTEGMIGEALEGKAAGILIRGAGGMDASAQPLIIIDGKVYTGGLNTLDPNSFGEFTVLKSAEATAIYGARAANGVILISTNGSTPDNLLIDNDKGGDFDDDFLLAAAEAGSIRSNFSDYAFWQPKLTTDKNGKASFSVVFPDDVTNWQTNVLAMNDKRQSGQTSGSIKSYKPVMAQLAVPNFLLSGDTAVIVGKSLNYMSDSMRVSVAFHINGNAVLQRQHTLANAVIDTLAVSPAAAADTLTARYSLQKTDGYFDGEERKIPVFPLGLEETAGNFYILDTDSAVSPVFDASMGEVTLYADASYIDAIGFETNRLVNYRYECNEQLASKLVGMLSERLIAQHKGEKPKHERDIRKIIEKLLQSRNRDGLWGWWKEGETNLAFSAHILNALDMASKNGFSVSFDRKKTVSELLFALESGRYPRAESGILILRSLHQLDSALLLPKHIRQMDSVKNKSLTDELNLLEMKQLAGMPFTLDKLTENQQSTLFGSVFYRDEKGGQSLTRGDIQNTLIAYRVLRRTGGHDGTLRKIRLYLLETKQNNRWWNTYESAQIIRTILPDMLKTAPLSEKTTLTVSGSVQKIIDTFPATLTLSATDRISVSKQGFAPVYLTTYQRAWNENPEIKTGDFEISTSFEGNPAHLTQGKKVNLTVTLNVKKDADFVMLNVPIPAGCSYGEKRQQRGHEIHREYFKNETAIFCEKLKKGAYTFEIELIPRFSGSYTLNPAKAELMYFPTFNANNGVGRVRVE